MEPAGKVTPSPTDGNRTLARTIDQASMGAHDVIDKVSNATRPVVDRIASGAHQAVDRIASAADQAAETLDVKGEQLKNAQVRAMEQCRGYVRDHPVTSLGIAIAAGFLVEPTAELELSLDRPRKRTNVARCRKGEPAAVGGRAPGDSGLREEIKSLRHELRDWRPA